MITPFYNTALNGLSLIQTGILYSNKHIQYIYFHSLLDMFCSPSEVISNIVFLYIVLVFCFLFFFSAVTNTSERQPESGMIYLGSRLQRFQSMLHAARCLWALLRVWLSQGWSFRGVQETQMKQAAARDSVPLKGTPQWLLSRLYLSLAAPVDQFMESQPSLSDWICQLGTKTSTHKLLGNKTYYLSYSTHTEIHIVTAVLACQLDYIWN